VDDDADGIGTRKEITAADGTIIPLQAYLIAVVILLTQLELKDI
jgi:hypothetical protein